MGRVGRTRVTVAGTFAGPEVLGLIEGPVVIVGVAVVAIAVRHLLAECSVTVYAEIEALEEKLDVDAECDVGMGIANHLLVIVRNLAVTVAVGKDKVAGLGKRHNHIAF